ncbi:acyl-CoA n-acyltransferase [Podospora aff. communis PSN243]|uniref:Acyl-CoA n-acyltransferase n=1 Tax=Podospora aff. communis PSN243 TaxID=3040156 RepID=A0AAV9G6I0_9PEZI|nr:acyl-CoA n-acyltransferase [Podospora aff. communis PSN243]
MPPNWRPMSPADIPTLLPIANKIHAALPESPPIYTERIRLFPDGCLILSDDTTGKIGGYTISHPIRKDQPPALDSLLGSIPEDADQFYIHDVVVSPEFRGKGAAGEGVRRLLAVAEERGFETTCLVSVNGTTGFWSRFGFEAGEVGEALKEKLKGYGDDAVYMVRRNRS